MYPILNGKVSRKITYRHKYKKKLSTIIFKSYEKIKIFNLKVGM